MDKVSDEFADIREVCKLAFDVGWRCGWGARARAPRRRTKPALTKLNDRVQPAANGNDISLLY
jgi:hypothetical protein